MSDPPPLHQTINDLHSPLETEAFYERLEEAVSEHLNHSGFSILYYDEDKRDFSCSYTTLGDSSRINRYTENHRERLLTVFQDESPETIPEGNGWEDDQSVPARGVTLAFQGNTYGLLLFHGLSEQRLKEQEEEVINALAGAAGVALVKGNLYESANREARSAEEKITAINQTAELLKNLDPDALLTRLMDLTLNLADAQVGSITFLEGERLTSRVEFGLSEDVLRDIRTDDGTPFAKTVLEQGESTLIPDLSAREDLHTGNQDVNIRSLIIVPLLTQTETIGTINIVNNETRFREDDFEILSTISNLAAHAVENAILQEQQIENERLKEEMEIARKIQSSLLPASAPDVEGLDLEGWSIPCDETGGDYFDFLEVDDRRLAVVVGDATGHGLGAALTMLITRAVLLTRFEKGLNLSSNFSFLSNRLENDTDDDRFMTLFCGVYDSENGNLTYCSAGHEGPLWYHSDTDEFEELEATGIPLGVMSNSSYLTSDDHDLRSDDILVLGTDGIWEAMNEEEETFGKDRLRETVRKNADRPAAEISNAIQERIESFTENHEQRDDLTLVIGKVDE